MSPARVSVLTGVSMMAFAGNSLLCRLALKSTGIDPASFASIRILSGALMLWLIVRARGNAHGLPGNWLSAFSLFCYAACFSFAYAGLPTGTGALLLFGAVQVTMIGYGLWRGERLSAWQIAGLVCAFAGLVGLLLPGLSAPPLREALLMLVAGAAWGIYSLRGKGTQDPARVTAGNFLRSGVFAVALSAVMMTHASFDTAGVGYAITSGALASGVGYIIWYTALRGLTATSAASVQLSVPVIAAVGAIVLLDEPVTLRLFIASVVILGGIALVIFDRRKSR